MICVFDDVNFELVAQIKFEFMGLVLMQLLKTIEPY